MKKNSKVFVAIALLIVATVGVIIFEACNKKNEITDNIGNANVVSISHEDDMEGYLLDLRKRMKSATKDGESLLLSDVEWNLTALENFGFCDGSRRSNNMVIDTFYTKLRVNEGYVSLYDLNLVYENNKTQIWNKYNSLIENDKNIYFIKCLVDSVAFNDCVKVTTITSMRNGGSFSRTITFGPTDYWYDFNLKGKCGLYEGLCEGRDATTEMNTKVLNNIPQYGCDEGRVYFTDNEDTEIISLYHTGCLDAPYEDYCLYINEYNYNRCLSPSDLNWYLNKILEYIADYENYYDKNIIDFNMYAGSILGFKDYVPDIWILDMYFATINCTHQPFDD